MATGDTLLTFTAESARLGTGTPGFLDMRNNHPLVSLGTSDEFTLGAVLPRRYGGGGITVYIHYAMATATTNNVEFTTSFERVGDGSQDIDSDGFATGVAGSDATVPGTSGFVDIYSIAHTDGAQIDSIAVGEYFRLRVQRSTPSGTDASGDAQVVAVELKET